MPVAQQQPRGLERAGGQHHVAGPHLALGRSPASGRTDRSRYRTPVARRPEPVHGQASVT